MKNFDATKGTELPLFCLTCEREIPGGNWFARIKVDDRRVAFCRPWCVEKFLDDPDRFMHRNETVFQAAN